jgi:hypothetical protein
LLKKISISFIFIIFFSSLSFSQSFDIQFTFAKIDLKFKTDEKVKSSDVVYYSDFQTYLTMAEEYELKKEENLLRRAEIMFFGSLTIFSFASWISFSIYNIMMYNDTFGNLRRDQFLFIYIGAGVLSFSVSLTDLFFRLKPKTKGFEFY